MMNYTCSITHLKLFTDGGPIVWNFPSNRVLPGDRPLSRLMHSTPWRHKAPLKIKNYLGFYLRDHEKLYAGKEFVIPPLFPMHVEFGDHLLWECVVPRGDYIPFIGKNIMPVWLSVVRGGVKA